MLDPQLDAPARDALAQDARGQIEAKGNLKHENSWGLRKMAYEINHRTEADYRWMRFEAPSDLLDSLDHNLKIADGVLRFRIFKVDPGAPVIVPPPRPRPRGPASAPPPELARSAARTPLPSPTTSKAAQRDRCLRVPPARGG